MAQTQTEAKPIVNRTQALVWLRQMMLIRRFEERAEMLYQKGNKIGGFFHQYSGQEPVAVGSIGVLERRRLHHHGLSRPRPRAGQGHECPGGNVRAAGKGHGLLPRQGRLHALLRCGEGFSGRPRDRRQPRSPGDRCRVCPEDIAAKTAFASAISEMARSTRARSMKHSTWPRSGSCR